MCKRDERKITGRVNVVRGKKKNLTNLIYPHIFQDLCGRHQRPLDLSCTLQLLLRC